MAFITDSDRPQPIWQPPPTARLTASGAASEVPSLLMHPCPPPPPRHTGSSPQKDAHGAHCCGAPSSPKDCLTF